MTISSSTRKAGPTAGNGVTDTIPFTFKVFTEADLVVVQRVTATDVETTLALTTDYTVSLNADQDSDPGGDIVIVDPATDWPTGTTITVTSELSPTQAADITNRGGFYASVINAALDKLTIIVQQVKGLADRSLKFPISDSGYVSTLPGKAELANNVLAFDSNGDPVAGPGATNMQALIDAAEAVIADSNAGAVSATHTSWDSSWTFTDVQGFMNQLCYSTTGDYPSIMRGLNIRSVAGNGVDSEITNLRLKIGSATTGRYSEIGDTGGEVFTWYAVDPTATKQAFISIGDYFRANLFGHNSELEFDETDGSLTIGGASVLSFHKTNGLDSPIKVTSPLVVADVISAGKYFQLPAYANRAAINAAIPSPAHGMMVMTVSQGMAVYKTSSWVRAVDETTAIT